MNGIWQRIKNVALMASILWRHVVEEGKPVWRSPFLDGDRLWFGSHTGRVTALRAAGR